MIDFINKKRLLIEKYPPPNPEIKFLDLIDNLEFRIDNKKYPNCLFWFRDEKLVFHYDDDFKELYCNYKNYWKYFDKEYNLDYDSIQVFTYRMFNKYIFLLININPELINILSSKIIFKDDEIKYTASPMFIDRPALVERHFYHPEKEINWEKI